MNADDTEREALYGSGEQGAGKSASKPESVDQEEQEMDSTALVPMKILQGKNPNPVKEGEEVVLKVVAVHGDECEVAYSETKPGAISGGENDDEAIEAMDTKTSNGSSKPY